MAERGLTFIGEKVKRERVNDLILKLACKRGTLEFIPPYKTLGENADAILVDEAGGIHVSLLLQIAEKFPKAVFASKVHGYEGAGRGFSLRFLKTIEKLEDVKPYIVELKEPIRYAPEDPVEGWLYEALLLSAEPAELGGEQVSLEEGVYAEPDLNAWFEGDEEHSASLWEYMCSPITGIGQMICLSLEMLRTTQPELFFRVQTRFLWLYRLMRRV